MFCCKEAEKHSKYKIINLLSLQSPLLPSGPCMNLTIT